MNLNKCNLSLFFKISIKNIKMKIKYIQIKGKKHCYCWPWYGCEDNLLYFPLANILTITNIKTLILHEC